MPSPSKSWTNIVDSQIDADSPLDTTLITAIRDDLVHIREWLGKDYTAAQNHQHNGADSAQIAYADIPKTTGVELFDDFFTLGSSGLGSYNSGASNIDAVNGKVRLTCTVGTTAYGIATLGNRPFQLSGGNTLTFETNLKLGGVLTNYYYFGFMESMLENNQITNNGIMFLHSTGGIIKVLTISGTNTTTTNTDLNWTVNTAYKLKIVATASSVKFYVNDVLKATHTTNIPTAPLGVAALLRNSDATTVEVDYIHAFSSARI